MTAPATTSNRVCALLFRRVGDSLLATPALRALKRHYPDCRLQVFAEPHVVRIFENNPWIDEIVEVEKPGVLSLSALLRRPRTPAIVVDFLSDPRSAWATCLSGAPVRVGFSFPLRRYLYTKVCAVQEPARPVYSALHKLCLANKLGCDDQELRTEFYLSEQDKEFADTIWKEQRWTNRPVAAFFIHSRRDYKRWPLKFFAEVFHHLRRRDEAIPLVLSTPGDENAVTTLKAMAPLGNEQILELRDLGHLAAVLERCTVLVGNDGGPKHLSVAVGTPTVTIFRGDNPTYWTPPDTTAHVALGSFPFEAMQAEVTPGEVIATVERLLEVAVP